MDRPPAETGPMQPSNLVSWMQQLNLSPGAGAYQQTYPPAVTNPYAGYADWQARSVPGISPAYLPHTAQSNELFAAHDLLASAPGYPDEAKGDDGEELEGGPEGEGKTRSKMQEKNRRAQKRFRERQKTKFAELTSKVEQLEARLAGVVAEKAKAGDRALILERCLEMRGGLQAPATASSSAVQSEGTGAEGTAAAFAVAQAAFAAAGPHSAKDDVFADAMVASTSMFSDDIELSLLLGGVQRLTPEAFKLMSPRDVIEVYESYVEAMRICLGEESVEEEGSAAGLRLVKLVHEISTVLARAAALNPVTLRRMHQHVNPPTPECLQENMTLSRHLLPLLGLSAAQGQQLVAVSARYRRQTCELVAARNELYLSMRPAPLPRPSASSEEMIRDFLQAHEGMDALKSNLRQEHWEVMNWVTKCFEITTPIQTARFMLGSHPRWFDYLSLSVVVAEELGLPTC